MEVRALFSLSGGPALLPLFPGAGPALVPTEEAGEARALACPGPRIKQLWSDLKEGQDSRHHWHCVPGGQRVPGEDLWARYAWRQANTFLREANSFSHSREPGASGGSHSLKLVEVTLASRCLEVP